MKVAGEMHMQLPGCLGFSGSESLVGLVSLSSKGFEIGGENLSARPVGWTPATGARARISYGKLNPSHGYPWQASCSRRKRKPWWIPSAVGGHIVWDIHGPHSPSPPTGNSPPLAFGFWKSRAISKPVAAALSSIKPMGPIQALAGVFD